MKFPFSYQTENSDCGPACLKMVAEYYGKYYELSFLKKKFRIKKAGVSMLEILKAARAIGFQCRGVKMNIEVLDEFVQQMPVILHWNDHHFVVVYKVTKPKLNGNYHVADPAKGIIRLKREVLKQYWVKRTFIKSPNKKNTAFLGYALLIKPGPAVLMNQKNKKIQKQSLSRKTPK